MKFVLVPVKDLSKANERLSSVLTQKERTRLAYTMLEDVFEAVYHCTIADKKVVVTLDQKAKEMAIKYGFEVINEFTQTSQSDSVDFAINICKKMGATSLLVIPGDAPLVSSNDIDYILGNEKDHSSVIMVPSRDNLGTNAILRKPPDAIPSRFGRLGSFNKHIEEAEMRGIPHYSLRIRNLEVDIDEPEDIDYFSLYGSGTRTYKQLERLGLIDDLEHNYIVTSDSYSLFPYFPL